MRARWTTSLDVRTQTEYGTLRAYSRAGFQTTTGETTQGRDLHRTRLHPDRRLHLRQVAVLLRLLRRRVLLRLLVHGHLSHDRRCRHAARRLLGNVRQRLHGDDRAGRPVHAPQRDLGCLQRRDQRARDRQHAWAGCGAGLLQRRRGQPSATTRRTRYPDIVGSLRVDQAWGSAQIAGALHQLRAGYYGNNTTGAGATVSWREHAVPGSRATRTAGRRWRVS